MLKVISFFLFQTIKTEPLYMDYQVQEDYVAILGYHKVGEWTDSLMTKIEDFRDQIDYLTNTAKCNWITMERFAYYVENQEKLPTKTCIMNFDDGELSQYTEALCTLNKHKVPATYYIAADNIGLNRYYMTNDNVKHLHEIGHDMEAHTLTHARLPDLTYEGQEEEIIGSKTKLESQGYTVKTFAYPYGSYDKRTEEILSNSDFVLARDTEHNKKWKDPRTPVISFNDNYLLHYYYIKPEAYVGSTLWEKIRYTGWWQLEDNFKIVNGDEDDIRALSNVWYLPSDISYGILRMSRLNDEIATQFLTKYEGGFTLDIMVGNATTDIPIRVKVDGVEYEVFSHSYDSIYSFKQESGAVDYYNFYINIDELGPGPHTLNIINSLSERLYLDRFRLYSNTDQDFSDTTNVDNYKECNSETDKYCECDLEYDDDDDKEKDPIKVLLQSGLLLLYSMMSVCCLVCILFAVFNCRGRIENEQQYDDIV